MTWRGRIAVVAVGAFFTLAATVLALIFAARALEVAFFRWFGDILWSQAATAGALLLLILLFWLFVGCLLRPRRRKKAATPPTTATRELLAEVAGLTADHPWAATAAAVAAGFATGRSEVNQLLLLEILRQSRQPR